MSSSSPAIPRPDPASGRRKHGPIPVIGLIGGIGAGKSRVADLLRARGACVIDADAVGHEVLEVAEVRDLVVARFGAGILRPVTESGRGMGQVDRRALGAVVFSDPAALRDLEAIVHPPMCRRFEQIIARESARAVVPFIVLDAAILLETGWDRVCDLVAFVDASFEVRLERVSRSRGWTAEHLRAREAAQWPVDRKRDRADVVLRNESSPEALEAEVDRLTRSLAGGTPASASATAPDDPARTGVAGSVSRPREPAGVRPRVAQGLRT